jgi:hypothetical protein
MDTAALSGLISVVPEVAKEVLLAVCIEEPKPTDHYGRDRLRQDLGLADWRQGYPAMYWKGPFLQFLKQTPKEGLDAIVRLVNYATARWIQGGLRREPTDEERKKYGFELEINGKSVSWVGDANVFAWNRHLPMEGDMIESALMALEKWLYEEIENKRDVTPWLQYILEHSQSAAFAGVLISVGLKYQGLFAGQLQPLLGNYYIYQCQMSLALSEAGGVLADFVWKATTGGHKAGGRVEPDAASPLVSMECRNRDHAPAQGDAGIPDGTQGRVGQAARRK